MISPFSIKYGSRASEEAPCSSLQDFRSTVTLVLCLRNVRHPWASSDFAQVGNTCTVSLAHSSSTGGEKPQPRSLHAAYFPASGLTCQAARRAHQRTLPIHAHVSKPQVPASVASLSSMKIGNMIRKKKQIQLHNRLGLFF